MVPWSALGTPFVVINAPRNARKHRKDRIHSKVSGIAGGEVRDALPHFCLPMKTREIDAKS
jgi:hypothetical protein